jgi:multidrug efflux pump subunit AcrB
VRLTHTFIDRPIFATVLSVFVTLIGLGALAILPVAQYPEIVPPTVQVTTAYPGASAETVSRTVATPLEQQINGVENMLYMSSQSTGDGKLTITVSFRIGTDLNVAQMLTQNRVQDAIPRLPEDVQRLGVQVRKSTPNILLAVHLYSPDSSRDTLYLSNYATLHVKDVLARLPGGSGSTPTRWRPITSTPAKSSQHFGRRTCRFRPASSISRPWPRSRPISSTCRRSADCPRRNSLQPSCSNPIPRVA